MLVSEGVQECAGDCEHSVLFGFAKEAQFTFNCFVHISSRCRLFSCQWLPVLGTQEAGNVAGWMLPCPRPEQDLPPPNTLHMAGPQNFNAWLLIALAIITFKLLVGDF